MKKPEGWLFVKITLRMAGRAIDHTLQKTCTCTLLKKSPNLREIKYKLKLVYLTQSRNFMLMNDSEYFEQRLENQIKWYSSNSSLCQHRYKTLRLIEIIAAAFIPLLSGMDVLYGKWIIGLLGMLIAIAAATGSLFKYHENWIQYRATSEALKHEKYLFLGRTSPYDGENCFQVLVQRVEGLISKENSTWTLTVKSEPKDVNRE